MSDNQVYFSPSIQLPKQLHQPLRTFIAEQGPGTYPVPDTVYPPRRIYIDTEKQSSPKWLPIICVVRLNGATYPVIPRKIADKLIERPSCAYDQDSVIVVTMEEYLQNLPHPSLATKATESNCGLVLTHVYDRQLKPIDLVIHYPMIFEPPATDERIAALFKTAIANSNYFDVSDDESHNECFPGELLASD